MRIRWMFGLAGAATLAAAYAAPLPAQSLEDRIARAPEGAVHFHFPSREGVCGDGHGIGVRRAGSGEWSMMRWSVREGDSRDDWESRCRPGPVQVELRVSGRVVREVETRVGATVRGGTDLGAVAAGEAVEYLLGLAERAEDGEVGEDAILPATLAAVSGLHPRLLRLAGSAAVPTETREKAVFWAAEMGAPTADLARLYASANDEDVREAILFAFGRREDPEAARALLRVARGDDPRDLRKKAVFWLGQAAGRAIATDLGDIVADDDVDDEVREQAVFALSQRPRDEGIPALLQIARTHPSPKIRKKAMFWLGESGDPRAVALFEELLIK